MGGTTRLLVVLTTPFPLLRQRCPPLLRLSRHRHCKPSFSHFHRLSSSPSNSHLPLSSPIKASQQQLHNQAAWSLRNNDYFGDSYGSADSGSSLAPQYSHPWPEWSRFIDNISASGYFDNRPGFDGSGGQGIGDGIEFVAAGELSPQFFIEAKACLAFAHDRPNLLRLLSRRDVELVVENGKPSLFPNAEDSVRKMKSFVVDSGTRVLDTDKACMVDLMKYMLSYVSNSLVSSERNHAYNRNLAESSVRNLFAELFKLSYNAPGSNISTSVQNQKPDQFGQIRHSGQKVEMKKGDWICPRCNFMNFARNIKCLECEEARPKRQLTGGEWECPQCDFFNYGRNMNCLRCDCKRPGQISSSATNTMSGLEYGNGNNTNTSDVDSRLAANEEKAQRWFSKVSQLDSTADINSVIGDDDFPEIMPLRKGVNRFVVSTRKTPLERRLANAQYKRNLGNDGTSEPNDFQAVEDTKPSGMATSQSLHGSLGRPTGLSQSDNKSIDGGNNTSLDNPPSISGSSSPQYSNSKESGSGHVPFVPLPADMFAQKSENSNIEESKKMVSRTDAGSANLGDSSPPFIKPTGQTVREDREKEQAEKSERWFKKVAELHNVSDLTSAISDEDFPEIMPMRKGENRFVVNKKKDRSLTSPAYKRRLAMEQSGNTNFVPFVPFPPDYFAKKDKQQPDGANSMDKTNIESSSSSEAEEKLEISNDASSGLQNEDSVNERQDLSKESWNPKSSVQNSSNNTIHGAVSGESSSQSYFNSQVDYQPGSGSQNSWNENKDHMSNMTESSSLTSENQNSRERWTGKSLEGSAVKEPDPLDMSEEAKAERWFRRVAQIKDISELSQIPDEDFPSIMPMRKGVNRFVVSKRKTPLERRLTSQQYRRNLPVINSDPVENENENEGS